MVRRISSGSPFEEKLGYSRAVIDGDMVYVSGTTGYDYERMTMPESAEAQARNVFLTISNVLEEAGSSLKDVVRVRYYYTDTAYVDETAHVLTEYMSETKPAATMIICQLIDPAMKLEVDVTARIGAHVS